MTWIFSIHVATMIVAFGLMLVLKKRKQKVPWFIPSALALIGGSSLANVGFGQSISSGLSGLGPYVIGGITLIWLVIVGYDIFIDHKPDTPALAGLITLPLLFQAGSGLIANFGVQITSGAAQAAAIGLSGLVGA